MPPRLGALLAVVFWGVSFVATRFVLGEIHPVALVFARSVLGVALLLVMLARRGEPLLPPRDAWPSLALMGFVGVAFHQVLQALALTLTTAVHTGWLIGLTPIWSALLSAMVLRERFPAAKVVGLLVGFAGAALVVTGGRPGLSLLALPTTRGDLMILASTLNWALYTVIGHPVLRRLGPMRATAGALLFGALTLAPVFLVLGSFREYTALSPVSVAAILFLGLCCSGLGYLFWYGALERIEASRVAALLYLEPLVTLGAAVILLGEPVGVTTIVGGALVLFGVALVERA